MDSCSNITPCNADPCSPPQRHERLPKQQQKHKSIVNISAESKTCSIVKSVADLRVRGGSAVVKPHPPVSSQHSQLL